jgi:hypothetical protein
MEFIENYIWYNFWFFLMLTILTGGAINSAPLGDPRIVKEALLEPKPLKKYIMPIIMLIFCPITIYMFIMYKIGKFFEK